MYVESLKASNFRCFKRLEIGSLCRPDSPDSKRRRLPNINVLLGENGSGKSSVMAAAAIGILSGYLPSSGFRSRSIRRHSSA
ncbi:MAG: AAA family ATPase [bacterium]|nr:AAA family ATPase [bacterium]